MTDIIEIKRLLAARALDVAQILLPNGRKEGQEWRASDTSGGKGKSLGVHLIGDKAGIWSDFATGETGDLLDLWCTAKRVSLQIALEEATAYLGISQSEPYHNPKPTYQRPPKPSCGHPKALVRDYLCEDRAIRGDILDKYKIGEDGNKIVFPFLNQDGELVMAKAREVGAGKKPIPTAANSEPILFGWQAIPGNARDIYVTEGEIDALSMACYGFPAVSVPFGGGAKGKQKWIENEFDHMARFEKIYLCTDMDEPGEQAAAEIANRLGRYRCYRVKFPKKDANECLVAGITQDEINACVAAAKNLDPDGLKRTIEFEPDVIRLFWPENDDPDGYTVPYGGLRGKINFRPGELTLWSGASGSGKSQVISDCVPAWIKQGSRVCIASLEMKPEWTLKRMVKQSGGIDRPTVQFIHAIMEYLDAGLLLYERVGKAGVDAILEIFDYARAKYGCDQFVIDSLMRIGIASDDYVGQEAAVFAMVNWAIEKNVHLHLVAHARKAGKDGGVPETEDIKGASEIGANAFNIITIYRNKKLESDVISAQDRPEFTEDPGVTLNVAKQRLGDFEGRIKMYFSTKTYQYFSIMDNRNNPRCYVDFSQNGDNHANS